LDGRLRGDIGQLVVANVAREPATFDLDVPAGGPMTVAVAPMDVGIVELSTLDGLQIYASGASGWTTPEPTFVTGAAGAVRKLMAKYGKWKMDFADACLVHLANELDTGRILTLDDDFDVYRWKRSRPFQRLVRRVP
jgi:hypothetical protein